MPISVASRGRRPGLRPAIAVVVRAALDAVDRVPGAIHVVLTDDAELRALNRRWRGIDRATDVLSFGYDGDARPSGARRAASRPSANRTRVNGDLVISWDRLVDQASRYRVGRGRELARLVVHGSLHLAGLDHARPAERRSMRRHELRALRACPDVIASLDRLLARP